MIRRAGIVAAVAACTIAAAAHAEPAAAPAEGAVSSDVREVEVEKKQRSLKMGDVEIQGERDRPKAMFILPKAFTSVEDRSRDRAFADRIAVPLNRRATESYSIVVRP